MLYICSVGKAQNLKLIIMKLKFKNENKSTVFNYCSILKGNVHYTYHDSDIEKNRKEYDLTLDFSETNCLFSKRGDCVIITFSKDVFKGFSFQFLITKESNYNELETDEYRLMLKDAFDLLKVDTLNDLLIYESER